MRIVPSWSLICSSKWHNVPRPRARTIYPLVRILHDNSNLGIIVVDDDPNVIPPADNHDYGRAHEFRTRGSAWQ